MAGLIPVGGGGGQESTCFRCGELASGPCARCGVLICAHDDCARLVHEPGLPPVVLCTDCGRTRPRLAARRWPAPVLLGAGLALGLAGFLSGSPLAGLWFLAGTLLAMLAGAVALARRQWRSQLRRARGGRPSLRPGGGSSAGG